MKFNKTYFIVCISEKINDDIKIKKDNILYNNDKNIKQEIIDKELYINDKSEYNNLVILTGHRLTLGISLENVDIVALFNTNTSADLIYQMMFRSLTEVKNNTNNYLFAKKYGFIVDLNPQRTIYLFGNLLDNLNYNQDKNLNTEQKQQQIVDLFNIDKDIFSTNIEKSKNDKDYQEQIKKFTQEFYDKLTIDYNKNYDSILEFIKNKQVKFNHKFINNEKIKKILSSINDTKQKSKKETAKRPQIDIPKGKAPSSTDKNQNKEQKRDIKDKKIDFEELAQILLAHIINTFAILSVKLEDNICYIINDGKINIKFKEIEKIEKIYTKIKKDNELKELFAYSIKSNILINHNFENDDIFYNFIDELFINIEY